MLRMGFLAATAVAVLAGPAQAAGRCNQPYAPVIKISAGATKQDLASLRGDVASFLAASDVYQACLTAHGNEVMIDASQKQKERIGLEFNALVHNFKGKS